MNFLPVHTPEFWIVVVFVDILPNRFKHFFALFRRKTPRSSSCCEGNRQSQKQDGENRAAREAGQGEIHIFERSMSYQNTVTGKRLLDQRDRRLSAAKS